ncbi:MAG TPA: hypothetical protein VFR69_09475 [Rubrobacteraceae bacterium]|nr:hypothetical protein [Rubrobacteraceae bacterium]
MLFVALILAAEILALVVLRTVAPSVPTLYLVPILPLTLVAAFLIRYRTSSAAFRMRAISPEAIAGNDPDAPRTDSPEALSRSIIERATEIRRTLAEEPTEIRVEMCTLGYKACVNDMITLTHLTNEQLQNVGFVKRVRLRRARKKATDALAEARNALPPGALRATRQEQP